MKKLIVLFIAVAFLTGCSITPKTKQIVVESVPVDKLSLGIPNPDALELREVNWVIVTEANIDDVWKMLQDDNEGVALFALRHGDYKRLALNIKDIHAQIGEYIVILNQYREYYEGVKE